MHVIAPAADYARTETLRDGTRAQIRAQRAGDRAELLAVFGGTSEESRYLRFFGAKPGLSDAEIAKFMNVDFVDHVALVATVEVAGAHRIAGAGRYIVCTPGQAEVAFMVGDGYQGQGIGTLLMRHLVALARAAGLRALVADVLPGNTAMLKVFERSGLALKTRRETGVLHLEMGLAPAKE